MFETELPDAADEKLAERACEETAEVVRIRLCLATGAVLGTKERDRPLPEPDVGPPVATPENPPRECALRRPLPSPPPLIPSDTAVMFSGGTFFRVLTEVVDIRRDRLRSRVTSRSSDRFPRGVN